MPVTYRSQYGLDWDPQVPEYQRDLYLARFTHIPLYGEAPGRLEPGEHFLRAIRALFTPEQFRISEWTEKIVHGFCNHHELILFGCAAASKSHSCGIVALLDFLTAPHVTTTFFCSTDKAALEKRSWASVLHFYSILKKKYPLPAVYSKSRMAVLNQQDAQLEAMGIDAPEEVKSGLFAVAAMAGSEQQAISKFIGVHQPDQMGGVRMFADEAQAVRKSFMDARTNLMIGTDDFRLVALGNPMSLEDPLGELACPVRGWSSLDIDGDTEWENKSGGHVIRFDGHRSPAIAEPQLFPFMINQNHISRVLARCRGDENHRDYLTMVRGWVTDATNFLSVFSVGAQKRTHARDPYLDPFIGSPISLCGFDPAFTAEGNNAVLVFGNLGTCYDGVRRLVLDPDPVYLSSPTPGALGNVTLLEYRTREALRIMRSRGVTLGRVAVDETATQSMGSLLRMLEDAPLSGETPYLVSFLRGPPEDLIVSALDPQLVKEKYKDLAVYAWSLAETYSMMDQLRGLSEPAGAQFAARKFIPGIYPRRLEPKNDFIIREKCSPDEADATALLLLLARVRFGFLPGGDRAVAPRHPATLGSAFSSANLMMEELARAEEMLYSS